MSILGAAAALRFTMAAVMYQKVVRSRQWIKWIVFIPLKDVLSFGIWVWSFFNRNVYWRGKNYKIIKGGTIREVG